MHIIQNAPEGLALHPAVENDVMQKAKKVVGGALGDGSKLMEAEITLGEAMGAEDIVDPCGNDLCCCCNVNDGATIGNEGTPTPFWDGEEVALREIIEGLACQTKVDKVDNWEEMTWEEGLQAGKGDPVVGGGRIG